jgi:thiol-disulfide isomerase/thioredoxin
MTKIVRTTRATAAMLTLAAFATAFTVLATATPSRLLAQESGIEVGVAAPDAALETLDGRPITLKSLMTGKPVVLEFWATWCGVCKELEPTMEAAQAKFGDRVAFVGVAVSANQSAERVRRYTALHLKGFTHLYDRRGDAVGNYDVPATSYVVIVDGAGKVIYTGLGGKQAIEAALVKALQ